MPDSPDFESIARHILSEVCPLEVGTPDSAIDWSRHELIEQLCLVWNARGAADIAAIDRDWEVSPIEVIATLDR
jgi:hypothetical protein